MPLLSSRTSLSTILDWTSHTFESSGLWFEHQMHCNLNLIYAFKGTRHGAPKDAARDFWDPLMTPGKTKLGSFLGQPQETFQGPP